VLGILELLPPVRSFGVGTAPHDRYADVVINEKLGVTLTAIMEKVKSVQ